MKKFIGFILVTLMLLISFFGCDAVSPDVIDTDRVETFDKIESEQNFDIDKQTDIIVCEHIDGGGFVCQFISKTFITYIYAYTHNGFGFTCRYYTLCKYSAYFFTICNNVIRPLYFKWHITHFGKHVTHAYTSNKCKHRYAFRQYIRHKHNGHINACVLFTFPYSAHSALACSL